MASKGRQILEARASVFKALGHPSRLALIDELVDEPKCVADLSTVIDADISTVSRHLSILRASGIVSSERRGNKIYYSLRCPCVTTFYTCVESAVGLAPLHLQDLSTE